MSKRRGAAKKLNGCSFRGGKNKIKTRKSCELGSKTNTTFRFLYFGWNVPACHPLAGVKAHGATAGVRQALVALAHAVTEGWIAARRTWHSAGSRSNGSQRRRHVGKPASPVKGALAAASGVLLSGDAAADRGSEQCVHDRAHDKCVVGFGLSGSCGNHCTTGETKETHAQPREVGE